MDGDPLWQRAALDFEEDFGVLGRRLRVRSNAGRGLSLADAAFGRFAPADPDAPTIELDIILGQAGPSPGGSAPLHREHDHLYLATAAGSAAIADLRSQRIKCFVAECSEIQAAVILESPVWRCLAWSGMVAIHAACIRLHGQTLVLRGQAGAGKSTLAAFALLSGAALLAEESVWFDPAGPEPCLRGAASFLHLEPDSLALLTAALPASRAALRTALNQAAGQDSVESGKLRIESAGLGSLPTLERSGLGPLVFLDRVAACDTARIRRLDRESALTRFEASSSPGERSQQERDRRQAAEGIIAQGAFELCYSGLDQALQALATIEHLEPPGDR